MEEVEKRRCLLVFVWEGSPLGTSEIKEEVRRGASRCLCVPGTFIGTVEVLQIFLFKNSTTQQ